MSRPYLITKIELYNPDNNQAYAKLRYSENVWVPVVLSKESLIDF